LVKSCKIYTFELTS